MLYTVLIGTEHGSYTRAAKWYHYTLYYKAKYTVYKTQFRPYNIDSNINTKKSTGTHNTEHKAMLFYTKHKAMLFYTMHICTL